MGEAILLRAVFASCMVARWRLPIKNSITQRVRITGSAIASARKQLVRGFPDMATRRLPEGDRVPREFVLVRDPST